MDETRKEMMESIADAVKELCDNLESTDDAEFIEENSKAICRLARAYALLSSTR